LVLPIASKVFLWVLWFSSLRKNQHSNSIPIPKFQFDYGPRATHVSANTAVTSYPHKNKAYLFIYLSIYLSIYLAVQEMIAIMQEHGEVVCCVGSSFNVNNTRIFTQADLRYRIGLIYSLAYSIVCFLISYIYFISLAFVLITCYLKVIKFICDIIFLLLIYVIYLII
jgi:hypothetical protein